MSLRKRAFSAVRWTTFSMLSRSILAIGQTAVLARILKPIDLALVAVVIAIFSFVQILSDFGVNNSIFHQEKISNEELSGLYWFNFLINLFLMVVIILASPFLAKIYESPEVANILIIVGLSFFITSLGQQVKIISEKKLEFKKIAIIEIISSLIGFFVALSFAHLGFGAFAPVFGILSGAVLLSSLLWMYASEGWRPMMRFKFYEIKKFISFGFFTLGSNAVSAINLQADILLGGKFLGNNELSSYSLPRDFSLKLSMIINPVVTRVGLPIMIHARSDREKLKKVYLKILLMTASINFPIYIGVAFFSDEIVAILFGPRWIESVIYLKILAIWGMIRSTGNPVGSLVVATGRVNSLFYWNLIQTMFMLPLILLGTNYGALGISMVLMACSLISTLAIWYFLVKPACDIYLFDFVKQFFAPLIISLISISICFIATVEFTHSVWRLLIGFIIGLIFYSLLSYFFNKEWFFSMKNLLIKDVQNND